MNVLIVEDRLEDVEIAVREMRRAGLTFEYHHVETREAFLQALREFRPDIIISDYSMPLFDGMQALTVALEEDPLVPFIVFTGSMNEATAVECMKSGATDYVLKSHVTRLPYAVTEALKRAETRKEKSRVIEALRESEQNFRTLADSGYALIRTTDSEGQCMWFNRVWLDFTGQTMNRAMDMGWLDSVHSDDREECHETFRTAFLARGSFRMEYRLQRHDGEYRWMLDIGSPRFNVGGDFIGYIDHCLDITDRKQLEESLRSTLEEKETLLRELYHRTRNSMQVIVAMLEIRGSATGDTRTREAIHEITERIISMSLVHKNLYETQNLSVISLGSLVDDLRAMVMRDLATDRRSITVRTETEPVSISFDSAIPCALVLYELLSNAIKHAFPNNDGGTVIARIAADDDDHVVMEVVDDGCGVSEEFDLWNHASMGLQFVAMIVEHQLRGTVDILNGPGLSCRVQFQEQNKVQRI